ARDNAAHASANALATSGSRPSRTKLCGTPSRSPSTGAGLGAAGSSPAITASAIAQQATLLAKGPIESRVVDSGVAPSREMRFAVGLNPTTPHSAAGMRTEPPVSVPIATIAQPSATETGAPADDPPGTRPRS